MKKKRSRRSALDRASTSLAAGEDGQREAKDPRTPRAHVSTLGTYFVGPIVFGALVVAPQHQLSHSGRYQADSTPAIISQSLEQLQRQPTRLGRLLQRCAAVVVVVTMSGRSIGRGRDWRTILPDGHAYSRRITVVFARRRRSVLTTGYQGDRTNVVIAVAAAVVVVPSCRPHISPSLSLS